MALILSALRRTGPLLWTLPYSANLTLRQIGLILLLALVINVYAQKIRAD